MIPSNPSGQNHGNWESQPEGRSHKKPSCFRRLITWMFFLAFAFGIGLALGLIEDFEAEELIAEAKSSFDKPNQRVEHVQWKQIWDNYDRRTSVHFKCRMKCRRVEEAEILSAVENGYLHDYVEQECRDDGYNFKFTVAGKSDTGRNLVVVYSANKYSRIIKLITVWEIGVDFDCPKDC